MCIDILMAFPLSNPKVSAAGESGARVVLPWSMNESGTLCILGIVDQIESFVSSSHEAGPWGTAAVWARRHRRRRVAWRSSHVPTQRCYRGAQARNTHLNCQHRKKYFCVPRSTPVDSDDPFKMSRAGSLTVRACRHEHRPQLGVG